MYAKLADCVLSQPSRSLSLYKIFCQRRIPKIKRRHKFWSFWTLRISELSKHNAYTLSQKLNRESMNESHNNALVFKFRAWDKENMLFSVAYAIFNLEQMWALNLKISSIIRPRFIAFLWNEIFTSAMLMSRLLVIVNR